MTEALSRVRTAQPSDAAALGRLHVRAWQAAYRGQLPNEFLDALDVAERGRMWAQALGTPRPGATRLVICPDVGDDPVGFAVVGPVRDDAGGGEGDVGGGGPGLGELYAINLDPDSWGRGLGRELLAAATDELSRLGFGDGVLWVVTGNARARRFYELAGWTADGAERVDESHGPPIEEVRYRRPLTPPLQG